MADESEVLAQAKRKLWARVSERFQKGATLKARQEAERLKEAAEVAKPKPPDPRDVVVAAWIASNPSGFAALCSIVDGMIQFHAAERRETVGSHSYMAFHEGECAALEQLRKKLTDLSGTS